MMREKILSLIIICILLAPFTIAEEEEVQDKLLTSFDKFIIGIKDFFEAGIIIKISDNPYSCTMGDYKKQFPADANKDEKTTFKCTNPDACIFQIYEGNQKVEEITVKKGESKSVTYTATRVYTGFRCFQQSKPVTTQPITPSTGESCTYNGKTIPLNNYICDANTKVVCTKFDKVETIATQCKSDQECRITPGGGRNIANCVPKSLPKSCPNGWTDGQTGNYACDGDRLTFSRCSYDPTSNSMKYTGRTITDCPTYYGSDYHCDANAKACVKGQALPEAWCYVGQGECAKFSNKIYCEPFPAYSTQQECLDGSKLTECSDGTKNGECDSDGYRCKVSGMSSKLISDSSCKPPVTVTIHCCFVPAYISNNQTEMSLYVSAGDCPDKTIQMPNYNLCDLKGLKKAGDANFDVSKSSLIPSSGGGGSSSGSSSSSGGGDNPFGTSCIKENEEFFANGEIKPVGMDVLFTIDKYTGDIRPDDLANLNKVDSLFTKKYRTDSDKACCSELSPVKTENGITKKFDGASLLLVPLKSGSQIKYDSYECRVGGGKSDLCTPFIRELPITLGIGEESCGTGLAIAGVGILLILGILSKLFGGK